MQVRTNIGALATAAVLAGALTLMVTGDGRSPVQAENQPAIRIAPPPIVDAHFQPVGPGGAPLASAPAAVQTTANAGAAAAAPLTPAPSLDAYAVQGLRGGVTYLVLFLLFHVGLRRARIAARWAYAGIGASAALACMASLTTLATWRFEVEHGRLSEVLFVIALAGAVMGFLYNWRAGLEADGDDPTLLARTLADAAPPGAATTAEAISEDGSLVDTGRVEYFNGPLQVRTSAPVMFVAALTSTGLFGLARYFILVAHEVTEWLHTTPGIGLDDALGRSLQSQVLTLAAMGLVAPVPFAIIAFLGHMALKALNKTAYPAYVVAGLCAPVLLSLLVGPLGLFYGLQAALPMAIAMAVYRNMAGLEPKAVKEDIFVNDRRNLVGADHARRQFGRLVKS